MSVRTLNWNKKQIREHIKIIDGQKAPSIVLKDATYLNMALKKWVKANIWIAGDRIIYVGKDMPQKPANETINCKNRYLVPGYIEPHAHPFFIYNPLTLAEFAAKHGTTTIVNDNLLMFLQLPLEKALSIVDEFNKIPSSIYWWARYDSQTQLDDEDLIFTNGKVKEWLSHPSVLQGGELTGWPKVLSGNNEILYWMQETKKLGKKIEGHFPGASLKTLTKMAVLGVDADHEAMTGEEVVNRLSVGMTTSLRYSSIRPDLPKLLKEMRDLGVKNFERIILNTDGSSPAFYEQGMQDRMIEIALEQGVPVEDAYAMTSYNIARHYGLDDLLGMIAPGRIAHINVLENKDHPRPISVMAKGEWVLKNGTDTYPDVSIPWETYGTKPLLLDFDITEEDLMFSLPVGIELINSVVTKPYNINIDVAVSELSTSHDESFLAMIDRNGKWRVTTLLKGFANKVLGFASSFTHSGDIVLIGKNRKDMIEAFRQVKKMGGGISLVENGEVICNISLPIRGTMSREPMEELIEIQKDLEEKLKKRGYRHDDPIYSLLFFSSTHLPFIRVTQQGIFDVKNKTVLFPAIMR
ncbi:adenine deaminase C-terminal domain-containing protein [Pueribacillus theae]|uniref:adenine deaminase C-terminal domain-containing protein n=1 Tax=Pueribacillus theae TaxID=2171751 RepID=UPI001F0CA2A0|nr:adenine deaminase C-terminal domain-containing protein [Pueribacillus theae]